MINRHAGYQVFFCITLWLCSGCQFISTFPGLSSSSNSSETARDNQNGALGREAIAIETTTVILGTLAASSLYTGTTVPSQDVMLKAEVAGPLVEMAVEVGDSVRQGQYLAQIDDGLINAQVLEEQARLASLEAELLEAETDLNEAKVRVDQVQLERQQAQQDNDRIQGLAVEGVVTQQNADLAQTTLDTAQKVVQAAQKQVQSRQSNVDAAQQQVEAQKAVLLQTQQQQTNTVFTAPITGKVLQQFAEPGTTLQVGDRLLQLGNFETLMIALQISDLEIGSISLGQAVTVTLDAFPNQIIMGRISQISPVADPISRLVPVEISVPNEDERIGSGLLARVAIAPTSTDTIVIPTSALDVGEKQDADATHQPTVFVLDTQTRSTVTAQTVERGEEGDRLVEIKSGLQPGDIIVTQSDEPLRDGQSVRLSILSQ